MKHKQKDKHPSERDYDYVEYYQKSMKTCSDPEQKSIWFLRLKYHEALRDYFTQSLRHINHLIQIDEKPNLELTEPRCEIYKISLSFRKHCKS